MGDGFTTISKASPEISCGLHPHIEGTPMEHWISSGALGHRESQDPFFEAIGAEPSSLKKIGSKHIKFLI